MGNIGTKINTEEAETSKTASKTNKKQFPNFLRQTELRHTIVQFRQPRNFLKITRSFNIESFR